MSRILFIENLLFNEYGKKVDIKVIIYGKLKKILFDENNNKFFYSNKRDFIHSIKSYSSHYKFIIFDLKETLFLNNINNIFKSIKNNNNLVVTIDSFGKFYPYIDLIYLPCFRNFYHNEGYDLKKITFGWDKYLIKKNNLNNGQKNITIFTGGSDAYNLLEFFLKKASMVKYKNIHFKFFVGPLADFKRQDIYPKNIELIENTLNINNYLNSSTTALCIYGVNYYQLLFSKVPTVVFFPTNRHKDFDYLQKLDVSIISKNAHSAFEDVVGLFNDDSFCDKLKKNITKFLPKYSTHPFIKAINSLNA